MNGFIIIFHFLKKKSSQKYETYFRHGDFQIIKKRIEYLNVLPAMSLKIHLK